MKTKKPKSTNSSKSVHTFCTGATTCSKKNNIIWQNVGSKHPGNLAVRAVKKKKNKLWHDEQNTYGDRQGWLKTDKRNTKTDPHKMFGKNNNVPKYNTYQVFLKARLSHDKQQKYCSFHPNSLILIVKLIWSRHCWDRKRNRGLVMNNYH